MEDAYSPSVVVQGPVSGRPEDAPEKQLTRRVLASVRQAWPGAEIILSTWKNSDVRGLSYDILIQSEDPGAFPLNDGGFKHVSNNLNRQLVSTRAGLSRASRRYAIKLRTDCLVTGAVDFQQIESAPRHPTWRILERPVMTLTVYTRHPLKRPVLFHVSDLCHAGLLCDLRTLWDVPLVPEPAFTRTINPASRPAVNAYPEGDFLFRCAPEQYIGEQLVRHHSRNVSLRHHSDGSVTQLFLWLRLLANNFLLLRPDVAGVQLPPHLAGHETDWDLFQPSDLPWLEQWTRPDVPAILRWNTALEFKERQLSMSPPTPVRRLLRRTLGAVRRIA